MQYDAQLQLTAYKWALIWLNHGLIADKWSGLNEVSRSTHPILSGGVELHCLTSFILLLIEKSLSLCLRMVSHSFTRLVLDFYDLLWKTVPDSYCWQTSFIIWSHLSPPENTPASQALQLSIEAHTGTPPAADWKRPPGRPRRNWLQ